jgi:ribosomal protein S20
MPIIKSAIKRAKQTIVRRERNVGIKKDIKTAVNAFIAKPTADGYKKAQSELDKAVKKGLLKKNTVARRKMRLVRIAKEAGVTFGATTSAPKATEAPKAAKKVAAKPAVKKTATKAAPKKTVAKKPAAKKAS